MRREKFFVCPDSKISAFTVRVPTTNVHGEAVWVTLDNTVSGKELIQALESQDGLHVHSEPADYPHIRQVDGAFDVHVGTYSQGYFRPSNLVNVDCWRQFVKGCRSQWSTDC